MKKVFIIAVLSSAIFAACGKSSEEIRAEKEEADKRVADSIAIVLRTNEIVQAIQDGTKAEKTADSISAAVDASTKPQ